MARVDGHASVAAGVAADLGDHHHGGPAPAGRRFSTASLDAGYHSSDDDDVEGGMRDSDSVLTFAAGGPAGATATNTRLGASASSGGSTNLWSTARPVPVDVALARVPWRRRSRAITTLILCTCWAAQCGHLIMLSIVGPAAACVWGLTKVHTGVVMSAGLLASSLGAALFGAVADSAAVGRRGALLSAAALCALGDVCVAAAPSFLAMLMGVCCLGLGTGGLHVSLALLRELTPVRRLRYVAGWTGLAYGVGAVLEALLSWNLLSSGSDWWRGLAALNALPMLAVLAMMRWVPLSPRFWVVTHHADVAIKALAALAATSGFTLPSDTRLALPDATVEHILDSSGLHAAAGHATLAAAHDGHAADSGAAASATSGGLANGTAADAGAGAGGASTSNGGGTGLPRLAPTPSLSATPSKERRSGSRDISGKLLCVEVFGGPFSAALRRMTASSISFWLLVGCGYMLHVMSAAQVFSPARSTECVEVIDAVVDGENSETTISTAAQRSWRGCDVLTDDIMGLQFALAAADAVGRLVAMAVLRRSAGTDSGTMVTGLLLAASLSALGVLLCQGAGLTGLALATSRATAGSAVAFVMATLPEVFPTTCRGTAMGLVFAVAQLVAAFSVPFAQPTMGPTSDMPMMMCTVPFALLYFNGALASRVHRRVMSPLSVPRQQGILCDTIDQFARYKRDAAGEPARSRIGSGGGASMGLADGGGPAIAASNGGDHRKSWASRLKWNTGASETRNGYARVDVDEAHHAGGVFSDDDVGAEGHQDDHHARDIAAAVESGALPR